MRITRPRRKPSFSGRMQLGLLGGSGLNMFSFSEFLRFETFPDAIACRSSLIRALYISRSIPVCSTDLDLLIFEFVKITRSTGGSTRASIDRLRDINIGSLYRCYYNLTYYRNTRGNVGGLPLLASILFLQISFSPLSFRHKIHQATYL
jgi:hypothetical protein